MNLTSEQLLIDAELLMTTGLTYAALILLGSRAALGRHLPQAEVVFEYRAGEASGPAQQRAEFREGLFMFNERLWELINRRNDLQHFQDGLFVWDIPTFNERAVREAILNAVSHRDYRLPGSVFVRQYPRKLEIVSSGGFLPGISPENILYRQAPRNRRVAEALGRCGLVERSGQGANLMYETSIRESKPLPDFTGTDPWQVALTLRGEIQDPNFLRFLEKVGAERLASFTTQDMLVLDLLHREQPVPANLKPFLPRLLEHGVIEQAGRGRHILSCQLYSFIGKKGIYTRKRGLDRETNKALLLKHIKDNRNEGSPLRELCQVLPALTHDQLQNLLRKMKAEGLIHRVGVTRGAKWFPGPAPSIPPDRHDISANTQSKRNTDE